MTGYDITYAIAVAMAGAIALGVGLYALALRDTIIVAQDLVTPHTDNAEQVKAHPPGNGEFEPDLAWPPYSFRQARADLSRLKQNVKNVNGRIWRRPSRLFGDAKGWWILVPVPAAIVSFLALASAVSWFCYTVHAVTHRTVVGLSRLVLGPAATVLRAAEHTRRSRMHTQAACVRCFYVSEWPAYQCPACRRLHHDVRPGRLGLLLRRCACGTRMPTRASRAAWRVTAVCERCEAPLAQGAGAVRDIRVPVFGDVSAGKTRFVYASLSSLSRTAADAGLEVSFPDEESRKQADFGLDVIRSRRETAKTSTNVEVALTTRLGTGRRSELLHMFDAAGEHFRGARQLDALRFLDDGLGLVYILDPFSVESIKDRLGGLNAEAVRLAHAADGDPELTYDQVASRVRDTGVPASAGRLAVVVSKADLLASAGIGLPVGSRAIAQWLWDLGVHNLVMSARRDFSEVKFFMVASQLVPDGDPCDPGIPLRWLLGCYGSRVPAPPAVLIDPAEVRGGRGAVTGGGHNADPRPAPAPRPEAPRSGPGGRHARPAAGQRTGAR